MWEVTKSFGFEAAHTLSRTVDVEASRRVHGHSYVAEVTLRGVPEPATGMVMDFGELDRVLREVRDGLDHRLLDAVEDLGPATMENICAWIWRHAAPELPGLAVVTVRRPSSGETCRYVHDGAGEEPVG
jgi:6-pyruvoyltetrahydropterin/6-carboxytetrahydropterin synthase